MIISLYWYNFPMYMYCIVCTNALQLQCVTVMQDFFICVLHTRSTDFSLSKFALSL